MPIERNNEVRSEEIDEIISHMPSGFIRWGIGLILFLFALMIFISWFVKYPDVINAKVVVTTDPSPIILVGRTTGKITLVKKTDDFVKKNDLIAYLQTSASLSDIFSLEEKLSNYEFNPEIKVLSNAIKKNLKVGDLQSFVNVTIKSLDDFISFKENMLCEKQIEHLNNQSISYRKLNQNLQQQLNLVRQESIIIYQQFKIDSLLFEQNVIALLDFNKTKSVYLVQQRNLKAIEMSIVSNQLQIEGLERQVTELNVSKAKEEGQLQNNVLSAISELSTRLRNWREVFLITAPSDGTISYFRIIENDEYVESGKPLFALLPFSNRIIARAELPLNGAGKVSIGQDVNIRLYNYPSEQFGLLRGIVKSISKVPLGENYYLEISLPYGMNTTYNKQLRFNPEMQGEIEIITEDLRLFERMFYQFRKLIGSFSDLT